MLDILYIYLFQFLLLYNNNKIDILLIKNNKKQ
jgi:hypothetical protein